MTDTKRMPRPMSSKELAQYRELRACLIVQAELIMSVFNPLNDREYVSEVEFNMGHPNEPWIDICYFGYAYGEDYNESFSCPERYLGMTEDELRAEKARIVEEEKRKKAERAAKAKADREKRKAEKAKKEAEKKDNEKNERYQKYLELKAEFEGKEGSKVSKPRKKSVYACKHWKYEYDDLGKYSLCYNRNCKSQVCDCKRIYAQQVCPFYEKGELRGKWVISDEDKEAAEEFKKRFEDKEET